MYKIQNTRYKQKTRLLSKHSLVCTNLQTLKYKFEMVNLNNTLIPMIKYTSFTFTVHLMTHTSFMNFKQ